MPKSRKRYIGDFITAEYVDGSNRIILSADHGPDTLNHMIVMTIDTFEKLMAFYAELQREL